jgi:hypothetical protein
VSPNSCLHRAPTSLQSKLSRVGLLACPSSAIPWSSTLALSNDRSRHAAHFLFAVATSYSTFGPLLCLPPPIPVGAQRVSNRPALGKGLQVRQGLNHLVPHRVNNGDKAREGG